MVTKEIVTIKQKQKLAHTLLQMTKQVYNKMRRYTVDISVIPFVRQHIVRLNSIINIQLANVQKSSMSDIIFV